MMEIMGKQNRQRSSSRKGPSYKKTAKGTLIRPARLGVSQMVGVVNGKIIQDGKGTATPYSQIENGGNYD